MDTTSEKNAATPSEVETVVATLEQAPHMLLKIHRGRDGWIAFQTKAYGRMENLFALPVAELEQMFPQFVNWLLNDAYFTVNSTYAQGYGRNRLGFDKAFKHLRGRDRLRWLNACYVDLDCGRPDSDNPAERMTWREVAARAGEMMDAGTIPPASIIARSGRGVYLLWLLRDRENATAPQSAYPEHVAIYENVNRELTRRLEHLAADKAAHDAARVLRLPGSYHTKAGQRVAYMFQADDRGRGFVYTLDEMCRRLDVSYLVPQPNAIQARIELASPQPQSAKRATKRPGTAPNRKQGQAAMSAARVRDIIKLQCRIGGFAHGHRGRTLWTLATILRTAGYSPSTMMESLATVAQNCKPPYPSEANDLPLFAIVDKAIRDPHKWYKTETLMSGLGITPELARELELESLVPPEVKAERKAAQRSQLSPRAQRRAALVTFIKSHAPTYPAAPDMERLAKAAGLVQVNHETVRQIYRELGVTKSKAGRPPLTEGERLERKMTRIIDRRMAGHTIERVASLSAMKH